MPVIPFKQLGRYYTRRVVSNFAAASREEDGLSYWQNKLFASIMIYILPLSLLAIVPGIIMSINAKMPLLAVFDLSVFFLLAFITFRKKLNIIVRKSLFISVIYLCAIFLLYFLGSYGPGLLYLMAVTIFTILIFNRRVAYWSVAINSLICFVFGFVLYSGTLNSGPTTAHSLGSWIAISSNLLVLGIIITALLPTIFKGMQHTIENHDKLRLQILLEQRHLEKTLEIVNLKNKELEEFAYMASHDMQEPLRTISGLLTQLEKNYVGQLDEKARRYVYLANDGAIRMKRIIADLLDYSLAEKKKYIAETIDLNEMIRLYREQNKDHLAEKHAVLYCDHLPVVKGDKTALQQVFQNLVSNALKYQPKDQHPVIRISGSETKRYWQIAISDNGIGIDAREFENVFVVFKRLHDKSEYPGTGIGLAICKKIIENHKGKIWIESEPGKGSTFYFTLSKNLF